MNRVLARQLRRLGLDAESPPADPETWGRFLARVAAFYEEADRGRYLLERAMDLSSREMLQLNRAVETLSSKRVKRSETHYRTLFHQLPVGALEEDYTRAVDRIERLRTEGVVDLLDYFTEHPEVLAECISMVEITDCNRAITDLLRVPDRAALLGPLDPTDLSESDLASWARQFDAIWRGERIIAVDFTGRRFDGSEFAANLHWTAPEFDGAIDYSQAVVVLIDITDRKAAEQRMKDLVRSKDEFLASVSHELRTPLTAVVGYADMLRGDFVDAPERATMLATIADQAADLSNIVEDLLVGARAELGQLGVSMGEVDVAAEIDRLRSTFSSVLPEIEAVEAPLGPIPARGDPVRVRQILRNLLSNAARYGGPRVVVRVTRNAREVRVSVCDDGGAIPSETVGRIFDRYFKTHGVGDTPGSVGIGLTISRDLARLMGGDLTFRRDAAWNVFELALSAATEADAA